MKRKAAPPRAGGKLTTYGKRRYAIATYEKGKAFLFAALLLRSHANSEPHEYVVRHLLCQGIELISKAVLLFVDYDKNMPLMERHFGHHIRKTADEALLATRQKPMKHSIAKELDALSHFYSQHLLRYGGLQDIFLDPKDLPYEGVVRRAARASASSRLKWLDRISGAAYSESAQGKPAERLSLQLSKSRQRPNLGLPSAKAGMRAGR